MWPFVLFGLGLGFRGSGFGVRVLGLGLEGEVVKTFQRANIQSNDSVSVGILELFRQE